MTNYLGGVWAERLGFGSDVVSERHFADDDYESSTLAIELAAVHPLPSPNATSVRWTEILRSDC